VLGVAHYNDDLVSCLIDSFITCASEIFLGCESGIPFAMRRPLSGHLIQGRFPLPFGLRVPYVPSR
jgi:hypothetical protein